MSYPLFFMDNGIITATSGSEFVTSYAAYFDFGQINDSKIKAVLTTVSRDATADLRVRIGGTIDSTDGTVLGTKATAVGAGGGYGNVQSFVITGSNVWTGIQPVKLTIDYTDVVTFSMHASLFFYGF